MAKLNFYYGNVITGYRLYTPGLLTARIGGGVRKGMSANTTVKGENYNCNKKLLKTTYRRRRKVEITNDASVVNVK